MCCTRIPGYLCNRLLSVTTNKVYRAARGVRRSPHKSQRTGWVLEMTSMAESAVERGTGNARPVREPPRALKVASTCIKAIVVLFPLPAALFTGAPPEMKWAAVYVSLVTLALFQALSEVAGGVRGLAEAVDRQRRSS
jgi:hypothetical protein